MYISLSPIRYLYWLSTDIPAPGVRALLVVVFVALLVRVMFLSGLVAGGVAMSSGDRVYQLDGCDKLTREGEMHLPRNFLARALRW